MKIIKNVSAYSERTPLALTIGMFDGVHLGHKKIIDRLNTIAAVQGLQSALLTFWPHPRRFFRPEEPLQFLTTLEEKKVLLQQFGLQNLILKQFDEIFRNLSGQEFVQRILVEKLHVKHLIIGYDHTFGKDKTGNFKLLQKLAPQYGFTVEEIQAVQYGDENISSTKIRTALQRGEVKRAADMLGYFYNLKGSVIHGRKIGRTLGFPTANLKVDREKLLPANGAYIVEAKLENRTLQGMLSIGTNPTVNGENLSVEVYLLDFNEDIYGKEIKISFLERLHDEVRFDTVEGLIRILTEDENRTRQFFASAQHHSTGSAE